MVAEQSRSMVEVTDIFREHGESYLNKYSASMLLSHKKTIKDILKCRTPIMGGKVYYCTDCNKYEYSYHSCGNRSCPKCQNDKANIWLEEKKQLLLPVNHFMVTFTIPEELRELARSNQKLFYSILFKASSKTMEKLSLDKKYVGGKLGMIGILHTWSRSLIYHPHVHYIVAGGGYSKGNNKGSLSSVEMWNKSRSNFLFPVKVLSKIYKAKFRDLLKKENPTIFNSIPTNIWNKPWVVNSIPVGRGEKALKYLAQYVFRIAISSSRIISLKNGIVTFSVRIHSDNYQDSDTKQWKTMRCIEKFAEMSLKAEEFTRRFLQHVLPSGFVKVRYYGLFASANRELLSKVREILGCKKLESKEKGKPIQTFKCKDCKKEMIVVSIMPRYAVLNNKAPPIPENLFCNLSLKHSAKKIFLR